MENQTVKFPISIEVVYGHDRKTKKINARTKVKCVFCSMAFPIVKSNLYFPMSSIDPLPYVKCPICKRNVHIVYYIDQVNNDDHTTKKVGRNYKRRVNSSLFGL